jgi:hypothetical protein
VENLKQGLGTLTYNNKEKYDGKWNKDLKHGKGKHSYPDGSFYEGNF